MKEQYPEIRIGLLASTYRRLRVDDGPSWSGLRFEPCESVPQLISALIEHADLNVLLLPRKTGSLDGITILEIAREQHPHLRAVFRTDTKDVGWLRNAVANRSIAGLLPTKAGPAQVAATLREAGRHDVHRPGPESKLQHRTQLGLAASNWIAATSEALADEMRETRRIAAWLCEALNFPWRWECDQAASLLYLGRTALPPSLSSINRIEQIAGGQVQADWLMHVRFTLAYIQQDPTLAALTGVIANIFDAAEPEEYQGKELTGEAANMASAIVRAANAYQHMLRDSPTVAVAWSQLRDELSADCPKCVSALQEMPADSRGDYVVRSIRLEDLKPGMYTETAIELEAGGRVLGPGQKIDSETLARVLNFAEHKPIREPLTMSLPLAMAEAFAA